MAELLEKAKADMAAAGLSAGAIDGLLHVAAPYKPKEGAERPDKETALAKIGQLIKDLNEYIKTQSEHDQQVFAVIIEKKKAELIEHVNNRH